jgi:tetratricopeptide (TPR) repeat protein
MTASASSQTRDQGRPPADLSRAALLLKEGESAYRSGRFNQAQKELTEAIRLAPRSAPAHALLGLTLARQRDFENAVLNLRQAHELEPENGDYAYDYAVLLVEGGHCREAMAILKDLRQKSPLSSDILVNLARAEAGAGEFQSLARLVTALPKADYQNPELLKALATVLAGARQTATLQGMWRSAIRADPSQPLPYAALAGVWNASGKPDEALAVLDAAPAPARGPLYYYARGKTLLALGKFEEASAAFHEVTVDLPQNVQAWQQMVWAEVLANHLHRAEDAANAATQKFPDFLEFHYQQAVINYMMGRTAVALEALAPALKNGRATDPRPVLLMAVLESQSGHYEEAQRYFARLPQLEPHCDALASYFYGATLLRMHRPTRAARELKAAIRCHPGFALAEYRLGRALSESGKWQQAAAALEQSIRDDPSLAEPYYALAGIKRHLGDVAGAQAAIARFNNVRQHVKDSDRDLFRPGQLRSN